MPACSVIGCKNRSENAKKNDIAFFSFPKNAEIASKWIEVCNKTVNLKNGKSF